MSQRTMNGDTEEMLTRLSTGLTRWVLGLGLLSLHATVYTIAMVGMVFWNIYDSPSNLWVDEVFYRWTAVLAFHAIAVACGWTAWRLMRSEQQAVIAAQRSWQEASTRPVDARPFATHPASPAWQQPEQLEFGTVHRYAHRADAAARRALVSSAAWSGTLARRTMGAVSTTATRLTHRNEAPPTSAANPAQTWPENPARHRPEDDEFIHRFVGPVPLESTPVPADAATDTVLNVTNRPTTSSGHPVKEPGQSWVQAATSAWHGPIDGSPDHRQNGHRDEPSAGTTPTE
ncbi:MAG: hypothetical protein IT336_12020 [Thermomicrobiales bacterium]|nr:hypothetical protein [Thermomicrobiales bacterium]